MMTNVGHSSFEKGPFKLDGVAEIFFHSKRLGPVSGEKTQPFRIENFMSEFFHDFLNHGNPKVPNLNAQAFAGVSMALLKGYEPPSSPNKTPMIRMWKKTCGSLSKVEPQVDPRNEQLETTKLSGWYRGISANEPRI